MGLRLRLRLRLTETETKTETDETGHVLDTWIRVLSPNYPVTGSEYRPR